MAEAAAALASLGVAANIFQFLDLAGRVAARGWKIYRDPDRQIEDVFDVNTLTNLTSELRNSLDLLGPSTRECEAGMVRVAKDCTSVADKLLERLGRLDELLRSGKKRDALKAAVVSVWKQDEMKASEQRLEQFKSQLALQLLFSIRSFVSPSSTPEQKKRALRGRESDSSKVKIERMLQSLYLTAMYPGAATPGPLVLRHVCAETPMVKSDKILAESSLDTLEVMSVTEEDMGSNLDGMLSGLRPYLVEAIAANEEDIKSTYRLDEVPQGEASRGSHGSVQDRLRDRVLKALHSDVMNERLIQVSDAHVKTFRWIFMPQSRQDHPWANFSEWLQDKSAPLYWITGKPGAGKSTLMKFILTHGKGSNGTRSMMEDMLQSESGEPSWTIVNYYAWYAGYKFQKSVSGLCRSLCYQLVRHHPNVLPALFPSCWEALWLVGDLGPQQEAVMEGLRDGGREVLVNLTREVTRTQKVLFLIDGLDEINEEMVEATELVLELVALPNVKVCASSRPWPIFQDAFGSRPQLAVHRLTRDDIKEFVRDKLSQSKGFSRLQRREQAYASRLVDQVAERSAGVFLWVALVVKSLEQGLMEDDRIMDLERRLSEYPNDLDMLFDRILGDVTRFHLDHLDHLRQYFGLLELHQHCFPDKKLTVLTLSFADEEFPNFAVNMPIRQLSEEDVDERVDTMFRRVESVTKGLLEVVHVPSVAPYDYKVDYLHRSVFDYLNSGAAREFLLIPTEPHRDALLNIQLASAYLCRLKGLGTNYMCLRETLGTEYQTLVHRILALTGLADRGWSEDEGENELEKQIVEVLDQVDLTGKRLASYAAKFSAIRRTDGKVSMSFRDALESGHWAVDHGKMLIPDMVTSCETDENGRSLSGRTFLSMVVQSDICSYVRARVPPGCLVQRLNITGNGLGLYEDQAMYTIWPLLADAFGREGGINARMVRQLLSLNANPGFLFTLPSSNDKTTPMQIAVDRARRLEKQGRRSVREFEEMRKLLVEMSNNPGCSRLPKELQAQLKEILKTPAKDGRAAR